MEKFNPKQYATQDLEKQIKYLNLLAARFPNIQSASTEIINLEAILNLPKGTEHFLSDIHGEYETFSHVLANASGVVVRKIDEVFGKTLRKKEKTALATLIYYPKEKLELIIKKEDDINEWYAITLQRLSKVARGAASKYTRSKVRKAMPSDFAYIIDELLNESGEGKEDYFEGIINSIINIDRAEAFIVALCEFIQRLLVDRLHIIGDIFDRGPHPEKVMDRLISYHAVDIQWGNHDIVWMGAAAGNLALIANVIRISLRYNNLDTLEDAYGINMLPLARFAMDQYKNDACDLYDVKGEARHADIKLLKQMQKAISIIQFKMEGQTVTRNPHFKMNDRLVFDNVDFKNGTTVIDGKKHDLLDKDFPTVDPKSPYELSNEEKEVMDKLKSSFVNSQRLQKHIDFLFTRGSMYLTHNSNLLYHGCIPMDKKGNFEKFEIEGKTHSGKLLCDHFDRVARKGYFQRKSKGEENTSLDYMWYLWCGPLSPLFGKMKMATFERYYIADKETHTEGRNPYYTLAFKEEKYCNKILEEFDLDPEISHIVNGHVPVKVKKGESPIKANGKLFVIDGGMSIPYQSVTGVSGYTLIFNSYGLVLVEHKEFSSMAHAIYEEKDIISDRIFIEGNATRKYVEDTDVGKELNIQISDLKLLLAAFRKGLIKEKR
ncbi:MAG: fructose-1,6-bisphosphatase [Bacteroidetes bacterium]|nr:fructose-1,6-bisphosphatase [Bacteroidota bacterium]